MDDRNGSYLAFKDDRPDWNTYLMSLCFLVAERSIDPDTKHGTVIVASDNTILSIGYNGPPRGCKDSLVPLSRPDKYAWILHSEEAAIVNAAKHGTSLQGCTFYVTGFPCERCMRGIINVGARKLIYGARASHCVLDSTVAICTAMAEGKVEMVQCPSSKEAICELLERTRKLIPPVTTP
jgi:dCMP deaminase